MFIENPSGVSEIPCFVILGAVQSLSKPHAPLRFLLSVDVESSVEASPIVNVEMKPARSVPPYANATVLESTLTRDLFEVYDVSCSKLSP